MAITELRVGGAERCLCNLAIGLDRDCFEPVVFSLAPRPNGHRDKLVRRLEEAGVAVRFIGVNKPRQLLRASWKLRKLLLEYSPDVIQTFLFHANVVGGICSGSLLSSRNRSAPLVLGLRVADPRPWRWYIESLICRRARRVVCVSESVAQLAREKMEIADEKLAVIPNGIDLDAMPEEPSRCFTEFSIPAAAEVIAVVGRLEHQKGIDWLLGLAPKLFEMCPTAHLLVVGDGPQREALTKQVQANRLEDQVHFAGWRDDILELLSGCRALALPSRWEGMPNVVLEAMACGLPIVATRASGVQQLLGENADEQLVSFGDPEAMLKATSKILGDRALAARLGQLNRQRVAAQFSLRRMIDAYQNLYFSVTEANANV